MTTIAAKTAKFTMTAIFARLPSLARLLALPLCAALWTLPAAGWDYGQKNVPGFAPAFPSQTRAPKLEDGIALNAETLARGLEHPWGIAALPEGGYLVSERPGRLRVVAPDGTIGAPIRGLPAIHAERQGGLLDVALAGDFATSGVIFFTYAKPVPGGSATAAARAVLSPDKAALSEVQDIFVQSPASRSPMHYGARVVPDGAHVFVTTGEHFTMDQRVLAQDPATTYGKVVRIHPDGRVPGGNPFAGTPGARPEVWTLGHRNVQGAALHPATGDLWTLEHGPQGGDELNRIAAGANYGWPEVSYGETYRGQPIGTGQPRAPGFTEPRYYWDPVIAPGGFAFYDGALFADWQGDVIAASLNPGGIVRLELDGQTVTGEARYLVGEARIRDIEIAPDGAILALVDARNGAILRLTPAETAR